MLEIEAQLARLEGYRAQDPGNVELACEILDTQFTLGRIADAQALLASLPQATGLAPGIRFRAARCALIAGHYDQAAAVLQGLIADGHENVALWHDLAFAQLCERKTADAQQTLAAAIAKFGGNAELSIVGARVAMMDGDFERAQSELALVLEQAPEHATALGLRALALLDVGDADAAYPAAKACLVTHPDQHEALLVAGTAALWQHDLANADGYFQRALARHPNSGRALSGAGQIRMLRSDLPGAREILRHAVVAMPDHIGTWHALAWTDLLLGDVDAAEASYLHAYDLDRNFADSHGGVALIHALKGRSDEADVEIKRALRLDPECATALYAKTLLLDDRGQQEQADQLLGGLLAPAGLPEGVDMRAFAKNLRARISGA